jgi:archaemetzincin
MVNLLFLLFLVCAMSPLYAAEPPKVVHLIPAGSVEEELLKELVKSIRDKLGVMAEIGELIGIPEEAFDARRNQYHSTRILNSLEKVGAFGKAQLMVVTEVDLFVPTLNFVFGEALPSKEVAIISLCRLRQEFYGKPADHKLLKKRMVKEVVHELGHVWGLRHCPDPRCVMFFSNSLADTDRKSDNFCKRCKGLLRDDAQK